VAAAAAVDFRRNKRSR